MSGDSTEIIPAGRAILPDAIDDYSDIQLSEEAEKRLIRTLLSANVGLVSLTPLICKGAAACPFASRCPIYIEDGEDATYPVGRQCLVEMNLARDRFAAYMDELDEDGKASESMTYRAQISKLVEFDIYDFRADLILAGATGRSDGSLLIEQTIAVTDEGDEVSQLQEHPALKIKERVQRQRMELLDAMGLTAKREAMIRAALNQQDTDNFLTRSVALLERIARLEEANTER